MKMRHLKLPSGIVEGIPFLIANHWTPEQAMAVVELLDDLREQINIIKPARMFLTAR